MPRDGSNGARRISMRMYELGLTAMALPEIALVVGEVPAANTTPTATRAVSTPWCACQDFSMADALDRGHGLRLGRTKRPRRRMR